MASFLCHVAGVTKRCRLERIVRPHASGPHLPDSQIAIAYAPIVRLYTTILVQTRRRVAKPANAMRVACSSSHRPRG